ncbi:MAG: nucleotide exchange factor GrpE [Bacilli bacterium]|nr:nucleotide exchange factor GrpE [Bacilli bacterium]
MKDKKKNECETNIKENVSVNEQNISVDEEKVQTNEVTDEKDIMIQELKDKVASLEEKILRDKADLINYRKRKDEEVIKMLKYANEDIAKELLPIVDNFEHAIKLDDHNLDDELSKFLEGFKMIYCNFVATLEKYDIKQIDGSNKKFDPTYHQAIMTEKVDDMEPEMVIEILQKGYLFKDKVIRPAMVKVSE